MTSTENLSKIRNIRFVVSSRFHPLGREYMTTDDVTTTAQLANKRYSVKDMRMRIVKLNCERLGDLLLNPFGILLRLLLPLIREFSISGGLRLCTSDESLLLRLNVDEASDTCSDGSEEGDYR